MQKRISFREQFLEYEVIGNGPPVMLVHGFTEDHAVWNLLVSELKEKYRWVIPDLPGSGGSAFNKNLHTLNDFAEALRVIQLEEQIERMVIIGHSMGGYIVLAFAEKFPEAVKGLGLFHSTAYEDPMEKKKSREKNMSFIGKYGSAPFVQQSIPGLFSDRFKKEHSEKIQEQIDRYANFNPDSLVLYLEAMKNRKDKTQVLKSISAPVLFIMGEEDKAVPLKDSLEQCHLPQISYIHILADTAHEGMFENTNLCNSFVDRFLEQIPI